MKLKVGIMRRSHLTLAISVLLLSVTSSKTIRDVTPSIALSVKSLSTKTSDVYVEQSDGVRAKCGTEADQNIHSIHPIETNSLPDIAPKNVTSGALEQHVAAQMAHYYRTYTPMPEITTLLQQPDSTFYLSLSIAAKLRDEFVTHLLPDYGPIVGYKAALTSPPAQARFGVEHPLRGVLLQQMLLESGATISSDTGTRLLFEPDLLVQVGSSTINHASTHEEAIAALDAVIPFIELPDLIFDSNITLTAPDLIAVNAGARLGIMGTPITLEHHQDSQNWVDILGNIPVEMVTTSGEVIAEGNSQALLDHPLNAVLWLVTNLRQSGQCLRPGDLLSLGSITAPMPVAAITKQEEIIEAHYQIAEERSIVRVKFDISRH